MYSTDSRHTSDYEDTDTEGGAYTDQELDETLNDEVGRVLVFLFFSRFDILFNSCSLSKILDYALRQYLERKKT